MPVPANDPVGEPPLRILHLEDDPLDAELAAATLAGDGLTCTIERVATREEFEAALVLGEYDVVLSDYSLPGFDGLTAQGIASRLCPDVPFIFLSGALGEDLAADRLKEGATDFVLKQRLKKLPLAIRRARNESALRDQARRAEQSLRTLNAELESALGESRQRLEAILEFSPHLIQVKDLQGRYVLVNRRAAKLLNADPEKIPGQKPEALMAPRLAEVIRAHDEEVIRQQQPMAFEESLLEADGVHVYASTRFPIYNRDGAITGVCDISHDITAQKRAEDEIKLARLEAMRASQAKTDFLSNMSHELRTPLNAILGFAQLFDRDALTPDQAENVQQILTAGRHLLDLINGILDISRVESGKLSISPEPVDVVEAINGAVALVKPLASERAITLDIRPMPWFRPVAVRADKQRMIQVLLNLLSNAVKYNRQAGRITIECEQVDTVAVRIKVIDTGAGIAPEKLKLLGQPFERLGAETSGVEGTGLGLAFSQALAGAMGGTLGVASTIDVGSTFWLELPFTDERPEVMETQTAAPDTADAAALGPATIVYIEDNDSNVLLMQRMLARRPHVSLVHVPRGGEGAEVVARRQPQLVMLDMHLPDMSGHEVLRLIRADPRCRSIPVIVLSADATPGLPKRLESAGARGFLSKPLNVRQALSAIDALLAERQGTQP